MIKTDFNQIKKSLINLTNNCDQRFLIIHSDLSKLGLYKAKNKNIFEDFKKGFCFKLINSYYKEWIKKLLIINNINSWENHGKFYI